MYVGLLLARFGLFSVRFDWFVCVCPWIPLNIMEFYLNLFKFPKCSFWQELHSKIHQKHFSARAIHYLQPAALRTRSFPFISSEEGTNPNGFKSVSLGFSMSSIHPDCLLNSHILNWPQVSQENKLTKCQTLLLVDDMGEICLPLGCLLSLPSLSQ